MELKSLKRVLYISVKLVTIFICIFADAEAKKIVATARGAAEANNLLNASITPTLVEWEKLQIARLTVNRWNGVRPTVEGSANLLFTLPSNK